MSDNNIMNKIIEHIKYETSSRAQIITRRTYNRPIGEEGLFETWEQTINRVIDHQRWLWCRASKQINLSEEQEKELEDLRKIFLNRIGLTSGRTLWLGGTDVAKRREASQFNCSFFTVQNVYDVVDGYWLLLQGCGVGFKAETGVLNGFSNVIEDIEIVRRKPNEKFIKTFNSDKNEEFIHGMTYYLRIGDSAESWTKAVGKLLVMKHKVTKITLDFSKIRPAGERLKGYGWISSGDESFSKALVKICGILNKKVEKLLDEIDILDIMNHLGMTLSSRRSAEICLMDYHNPRWREFATIKKEHWIDNPQRSQSNNSIMFWTKPTRDQLKEVFDLMIESGGSEPGFINAEHAKRRADYFKGVNPCFSGETLIATADGRNYVSIKQLAEEGKDVPVYSINPVSHEVSIKWGRNPRITGENMKLLRIHFSHQNKDEYIDVTPNHKFLTNDGRTVEAKDLKKGDSLPKFKKSLNGKDDYVVVYTNDNKRKVEHRMIKEFYNPEEFLKTFEEGVYNGCCKTDGVAVHHKDENKQNNNPDNLEITTASEHTKHHNDFVGEKNPMFGKKQKDSTKKLISEKAKEIYEDEEYYNKMISVFNAPERIKMLSEKMKEQRYNWTKEYYDEIEKDAYKTGLNVKRISDKELVVYKTCENKMCNKTFETKWSKRERCFCTSECFYSQKTNSEETKRRQKETFEGRLKENFHKQAMLYKDMLEKNETVMKKEFVSACKENNISCRFSLHSENPWIPKSWNNFKEMVDDYNHRVSYIEEIDGEHTVYNITVEDNHTLAVVTKASDDKLNLQGIYTFNCGEILLGNRSFCNLSEIDISKFNGLNEEEMKYIVTLIARANYRQTCVNLDDGILQRSWHELNEFLRLTGVGLTGIVCWEHAENPEMFKKLKNWAKEGVDCMSSELKLPKSKNVTTIKPSGTLSKIMDCTEGVHKPLGKYIFNHIRFSIHDPLIDKLKKANYYTFPDPYSPDSILVRFPVCYENVLFDIVNDKEVNNESAISQLNRYKMLMENYVDHNCSITVSYSIDEVSDILDWFMENWESYIGVSFLFRNDASKTAEDLGYPYLPQQVCTKEEHDSYVKSLLPFKLDGADDDNHYKEFEIFSGSECSGGVCPAR